MLIVEIDRNHIENPIELPPALAGGIKDAKTIWALAQIFASSGLKPRFQAVFLA